ncbi:MAG: serine O-acetyltransferase [Pseudomonadota bacterium]
MPTSTRSEFRTNPALSPVDPVWTELRREAEIAMEREPVLGSVFFANVLQHDTLEIAAARRVARRLATPDIDMHLLTETFQSVLQTKPELGLGFRADLAAVYDRDPACTRYLEPFLYFKGFHALVAHRFAHELWNAGRKDFALYLQSLASSAFSVDINPATRIGVGIMIDHGHGIVIGQTAEIGDNVSILQGVTLGGTGKESGDRHPKIGDNVLIGAGAKVLGNIRVGDCSRVAAGSVVLKEVPPKTTVAGVPAKVVGPAGCPEPARTMDQLFPVSADDRS